MWIKKLSVCNCRIIKNVNLELSPGINLIIGDNASGKTSLLEALSLLSTGRSFRSTYINDVIATGSDSILVTAKLANDNCDEPIHIGVQKTAKETTIRMNQQDIKSQSALSRHIPLTVIHPASTELISGGPKHRRSYIDWITFYLFPEYVLLWKSYKHILKQRNSCLKFAKHRASLSYWTEELIKLQPDIHHYRTQSLKKLHTIIKDVTVVLLKDHEIELELISGLPSTSSFSLEQNDLINFYAQKLDYDLTTKRTNYGIHRSDINIKLNGSDAKKSASRGQLKILAISLLIAQTQVISSEQGKGMLLIDDLDAELDQANKSILINYLISLDQQLIITSTKDLEIEASNLKMFHVKHGVVEKFAR